MRWDCGQLAAWVAPEPPAALMDRAMMVRHNRARLARSVGPPCSQCRRWWASHQAWGRWQPGNIQPPSRTARAARWAAVTTRLLRPTSSGWVGHHPAPGQPDRGGLEPGRQAAIAARAIVVAALVGGVVAGVAGGDVVAGFVVAVAGFVVAVAGGVVAPAGWGGG
jgi:hypothetical protein